MSCCCCCCCCCTASVSAFISLHLRHRCSCSGRMSADTSRPCCASAVSSASTCSAISRRSRAASPRCSGGRSAAAPALPSRKAWRYRATPPLTAASMTPCSDSDSRCTGCSAGSAAIRNSSSVLRSTVSQACVTGGTISTDGGPSTSSQRSRLGKPSTVRRRVRSTQSVLQQGGKPSHSISPLFSDFSLNSNLNSLSGSLFPLCTGRSCLNALTSISLLDRRTLAGMGNSAAATSSVSSPSSFLSLSTSSSACTQQTKILSPFPSPSTSSVVVVAEAEVFSL